MANATQYEFTSKVTAKDTFEGLQTACDLFVAGTLSKWVPPCRACTQTIRQLQWLKCAKRCSYRRCCCQTPNKCAVVVPAACCRLDGVKQLHVILLAVSLVALAAFVVMLYRPYLKSLRRDTKAIVNMLSQLPAEVDVEGNVKSIVLGVTKTTDGSKSMEGMAPGLQMQPYGMPGGAPGMASGPAGMRGGWGMGGAGGGGAGGGGGWFGRGNGGAAQQGQGNDPRINGYGMHAGMGPPGMQYGGDMA